MAMARIYIAAQFRQANLAPTASVSASCPLILIYNKTTSSASSPGRNSRLPRPFLVILSASRRISNYFFPTRIPTPPTLKHGASSMEPRARRIVIGDWSERTRKNKAEATNHQHVFVIPSSFVIRASSFHLPSFQLFSFQRLSVFGSPPASHLSLLTVSASRLKINRTPHSYSRRVEYVRVNHRRTHILVS
jgi:hypothetical protein